MKPMLLALLWVAGILAARPAPAVERWSPTYRAPRTHLARASGLESRPRKRLRLQPSSRTGPVKLAPANLKPFRYSPASMRGGGRGYIDPLGGRSASQNQIAVAARAKF